jgi:hypothetical protein
VRLPVRPLDELPLQRGEEALGHGVDAQQLPFLLMLPVIPCTRRISW